MLTREARVQDDLMWTFDFTVYIFYLNFCLFVLVLGTPTPSLSLCLTLNLS